MYKSCVEFQPYVYALQYKLHILKKNHELPEDG